jgi:hypothetical protein
MSDQPKATPRHDAAAGSGQLVWDTRNTFPAYVDVARVSLLPTGKILLDWGMKQTLAGDAAPHTLPAIHREIFHPRLAQDLIDGLHKVLNVLAQRASSWTLANSDRDWWCMTRRSFRQVRSVRVIPAQGPRCHTCRRSSEVGQAAEPAAGPMYRSTTSSTAAPRATSAQAARSTSRWWSWRSRASTSDRLVLAPWRDSCSYRCQYK